MMESYHLIDLPKLNSHMFKFRPLQKVIHYLDLYKNGILHGEYLIIFIQESFKDIKNDDNIASHCKKAVEYFIAKTELYESDPKIRENEKCLTGDQELVKEIIVLEEILLQRKIKNFKVSFIPKSIIEERDGKKMLFSYIDLYKKNELEEKDFILFIWLFFSRYMNIEDFSDYSFSIGVKLKNFKKLHENKNFNKLSIEEKKFIREMFLSLRQP